MAHRQLRAHRRAARRGRPPYPGALHTRLASARVLVRRHRPRRSRRTVHTVVEGTTAKSDDQRRRADDAEERHDCRRRAARSAEQFFWTIRSACRPVEDGRGRHDDPALRRAADRFLGARRRNRPPNRFRPSSRVLATRRTRIVLLLPGTALEAELWTDEASRLVRLSIPSQAWTLRARTSRRWRRDA